MRPLFADAVPTDDYGDVTVIAGADRARERREERYLEWRRTRVLFMQASADADRMMAAGDLPQQRGRGAL